MDFLTFAGLFLLGAVISVIGAVLGIGAGFIIVPVMVIAFGLPIHGAIAVSLTVIIAMSLSAARVNVRRGFVNIPLAAVLEPAAVLGAAVGAMFAVKINPDILKTVFSFVLLAAALIMIKKTIDSKKENFSSASQRKRREFDGKIYDYKDKKIIRYEVKNFPAAAAGILSGGILSGLTGIGGGIINVPVLNLICKMPVKAAGATSGYMLSVTACSGAVVYILKGYLNISFVLPVLAGVILAGGFGAKILHNIKSKYLEILFAFILVLAAVKMFIR
jgi:uncharacterized membrane protein YfcA